MEKEQLIKEFRESELKVAQFCAKHKLKASTFRGWLKRSGVNTKKNSSIEPEIPEESIVTTEFKPILGRFYTFVRHPEYNIPSRRVGILINARGDGVRLVFNNTYNTNARFPWTIELQESYEKKRILITGEVKNEN